MPLAGTLLLSCLAGLPPLQGDEEAAETERRAGSVEEGSERIMAEAERAWNRGDVVGAMGLLAELAERGHVPAQTRLGYILHRSNQSAAARDWYERAATAGDPDAQFALARLYLGGVEGVPKDERVAQMWIFRATELGHLPAMRLLAMNYESGGMGLSKDTGLSLQWLRRAAEQGDSWASHRLQGLEENRKR